MSEKKPPSFKNDALKDALGQWKKDAAPAVKPVPAKPAREREADHRGLRYEPGRSMDDEAFFRLAMEEVVPLEPKKDVSPAGEQEAAKGEDAEALAELAELVATGEAVDVTAALDRIEGLARGVDPSLLVPLRRGDFAVGARIDLHGLATDPARASLERALVEARRRGLRAVLVVVTRSLGPDEQLAMARDRLVAWLSRGKLARIVLAFTTARPQDGGPGAAYVLLRR